MNIDSDYESIIVQDIAKRYRDKQFAVGVRYNMDIEQDVPSRFGIPKEELRNAINRLNSFLNLRVAGLHCHLPFRSLDSFRDRMENLENLLQGEMKDHVWSYISLGGGYMGKISDDFAGQFSFEPPSYEDYAKIVAGGMAKIYKDHNEKPKLIIEPGSALVADTMRFVTRVVNIKYVRGKAIATLTGSTYNMNPSVKSVKRPITVYSGGELKQYEDLDMAGYTCIESDYLFKNYSGKLAVGDFVVFHNVGSYSVVMKPPFILPDVPILELEKEDFCLIKKKQNNESVFMDFL
ncbi:MAG: pyridoxal-dependent decarboxylase [Clostridium sp.]|nr:pyridoxal-dependent decarboxylase [Clostridium sp.]